MFSRRPLKMGAAALCCLLFACVRAYAAQTLYVDTNAAAGGNGTRSAPVRSIGAAIALAVPGAGDTIKVKPGEYAEAPIVPPATWLLSTDGSFSTYIVGNGADGDGVRLDNGAGLRGFTVKGFAGAGISVPLNGSATVSNCIIAACGDGIHVVAGASLSCANCTFFQNTRAVFAETGARLAPLENNIFSTNGTAVMVAAPVTVSNGYNGFHANDVAYDGATPAISDVPTNPQFVDADKENFHLRLGSRLRNAGDPASQYLDRDGTRNDVGADGGPFGVWDVLAPRAVADSTPGPPAGDAPLSVAFDGALCDDEWGIAEFAWDFNLANGLQIDQEVAAFDATYSRAGGYLLTLSVTDNSGNVGETIVPVRAEPAPAVTIDATNNIGPAPLNVLFRAEAEGSVPGTLDYEWDFDGDNIADTTAASPTFSYGAAYAIGHYRVVTAVTDPLGIATQAATPVSVTLGAMATSRVVNGGAANLSIANPSNPLNGAKLIVPAGAFNESVVIGIGAVDPADIPYFPEGLEAAVLVEAAPANYLLTAFATVEAPANVIMGQLDSLSAWRFDVESQTWSQAGLRDLDVPADGTVRFQASVLGVLAVLRPAVPVEPPPGGPCFLATAAYGSPQAPALDALRGFRDHYLLENAPGTALVDLYYRLSPPLADWLAQHSFARKGLRLMLSPLAP